MSRRENIINFILSMGITLVALLAVVLISNDRYQQDAFSAIFKLFIGATFAGLVNTIVHELAHLCVGKKNGFAFSALTIWFFKWKKVGGNIRFSFTMFGDEAGYTEMIPTNSEKLDVRFKKMASAGYKASFILMLVGIPALFLPTLSVWVFCLWGMFFPVGAYFFFFSALPSSSYGVRNDGGVVKGIKIKDDSTKVALSMLAVQSELYQGKTPSEIDERLYFDLPQLPEDDLNFIVLLNARYNYYLDKGEYEKAKTVMERLIGLVDDLPKEYASQIMTNALYNFCTFDYNEEQADNIAEDYEKHLNSVNDAPTVRAKLAYLLYIKGETEAFDIFYKKGIKEADRCQIKGLGLFEKKLFEKMKSDFEKSTNK